MGFYVDYAAHVGHPIAHTSSVARVTLGIGAAIIAGAIATVVTEGGFLVVAFAAATQASRVGAVGQDVGGIIDGFRPPSIEGYISTGFEKVLLGPTIKPAARAMATETQVDCDHTTIAEGSRNVVIGPDFKPMVRRQDKTSCLGIVADGLHTVIVGGEPSGVGESITETDRPIVRLMSLAFGLGGAARSLRTSTLQGGARAAAAVLAATDHPDAAAAIKLGTTLTSPFRANPIDAWSALRNIQKGSAAAVNLGAGLVTR